MPKLVAHGLSFEEYKRQKSEQTIDRQFSIESMVEKEKKSKIVPIGPETSSWVSRMLWLWVSELVSIANRMPLTDGHLGNCPESSLCDNVMARFDVEWNFQKNTKPKPDIVNALFGTFSWVCFRTGVTEIIIKTSQLVVPIVVQMLLKWYASDDGTTGTGLGYAFILLGSTLIFQCMVQVHNFMLLFKTGMDVRTILCASIYEKALTISASEKTKLTVGEIVNLMSADAEKIVFSVLLFHGLWTTPLFLAAAIYLLVNLVGSAIGPGLGMLVFTAPIQGYVISSQHRLQRAVMKVSDRRVKLVNEVLQGVRVVKYYNWEESFQKRLGDLRKEELVLIRKLAKINALNSALMTTVPLLMLIAMLVTFYASGGDFKPETIFVAVSLLILIRFPLIMLPMTIGAVVMGRISLKRIEKFLLYSDMPRFQDVSSSSTNEVSRRSFSRKEVSHLPKGTIQVNKNEFAWAITAADGSDADKTAAGDAKKKDDSLKQTNSPSSSSIVAKNEKSSQNLSHNGGGEIELSATLDEDEEAFAVAVAVESSAFSDEAVGESGAGGGSKNKTDSNWKLKLDDFTVKAGTLLAVTGRVGSGKSSFLAALLGELDIGEENFANSPLLSGSVSYAPQQAWIMNATLRENIVFGRPFQEDVYREVLDCCCLGPDLATLPAGDRTEIGEKGINLSGGQKARIGLARAVYSDSDIVLLDDVLAAVDSHVGRKLFESCIVGRLRARGHTVVLVTNQLGLLAEVDDVIVIDNGVMAEHGTCEELRAHKQGAFSKLMETYVPEDSSEEEEEEEVKIVLGKDGAIEASPVMGEGRKRAASSSQSGAAAATPTVGMHNKENDAVIGAELRTDDVAGDLIADEEKAVGTVGAKVYKAYFVDSVGGSYFNLISLIGLSIGAQAATLVFEWWLAYWSDEWSKKNDKGKDFSKSESLMYMLVYIGLGFFALLVGLFRYLNHARHAVHASQGLFDQLLHGVIHTSVSFFDVTPVGRILNRFSKDTDSNDTQLPQNLMSFDLCLMSVLGSLIMCAVMMPPFILVLLPVLFFYFRTLIIYVPLSRDLQRLESISRSPIFAQFSETLSGTAVIRAFGRTRDFIRTNRDRLDQANRPFFFLQNSNRWLQVRLETLGSVIIFSVAMIVVWSRAERTQNLEYGLGGPILGNSITVGIAGLVLTYTQQITGLMNWAVRMACEVENRMTNVERNVEYANLTPEEPMPKLHLKKIAETSSRIEEAMGKIVKKEEKRDWPINGHIVFDNVNMRYRPGLPLVLKDVQLNLPGGSKVGFCGRSGSGKSSILVALFRITKVEGSIRLDGKDINSLSLRQLRRTVGIIPQDPVLFVGNLRDNLDAFHEYEDAEIHEALRCACLDTPEVQSQHPGGLAATVDEGGSNWSTGQRQLICLARAVLRAPVVLAIDEATANIDLETDAIVQQSIRTKFKNATTITIAHRLQTIMDSDIIVTMDDGRVAECDSPANLLSNKDSLFTALVMNDKGAATAAGLIKSNSSGNISSPKNQ